jgi:hypothetical protein
VSVSINRMRLSATDYSFCAASRFATRVQQAIDSGRLDPNVVHEISSLPSGAFYFARATKSRKKKVKPSMYEVRLGGAGHNASGGELANSATTDQTEKGLINWNEIMVRRKVSLLQLLLTREGI